MKRDLVKYQFLAFFPLIVGMFSWQKKNIVFCTPFWKMISICRNAEQAWLLGPAMVSDWQLGESLVSVRGQLAERKLVLGKFVFSVPFLLALLPVPWALLTLSDPHLSLEHHLIASIPVLYRCIPKWTICSSRPAHDSDLFVLPGLH